uniref:Uncharacterized protein n=1 Tax=Chelonoidis abingdonii TaxID=106734 RepID=A0A8C0H1L9_CHEAB
CLFSNSLFSFSSLKQTLIISGAIMRARLSDKVSCCLALNVAHQKPQPCLEKFAPQHRINQHIPQPRK